MTEQQIADLGPAFAGYLKRFGRCFPQKRVAAHFDTFCRGMLSDMPRKSVEPMALESGTAVRTLQEFLATTTWDHEHARDLLQRRLAAVLADLPDDELGTVGVIDETSCRKWGEQTPGVQRQYLGCVGKIDSGIVTVHIGVAKGTFQALLDADLYLPQTWAEDRNRCRDAGIPDEIGYRAKWRIALDQWMRLGDNGVSFDWLTFDEGYGSKVPFLWVLGVVGQKFVAEVPVNFTVRRSSEGRAWRADELQPGTKTEKWQRFRLARKTVADQVWRARSTRVWAAEGWHQLVTAINEATGEVKFFVTNAVEEPLERVLRVAFRRATIEHAFRLAKQEAGLMHYEGRHYVGLVRHLVMALVVLGFVAEQTQRLRGEKPRSDGRASVPGIEPAMRPGAQPTPRRSGTTTPERSDRLLSATQRRSHTVPQEAAA
ncbi:MAG: IS701 family transposase [Burkholderiales bacterium]